MSDDLRTLWPTLSAREKDARVAEALGLVLWKRTYHTSTGPYVQQEVYPVEHHPLRVLHLVDDPLRAEVIPWTDFASDQVAGRSLADYSTWEHAGLLLDRLREEGWTPIEILLKEGEWRVHLYAMKPYREAHAWSTSGPDAIALGFVLSRRAGKEEASND